jgi:hypothetical protein
MLQSRDSNDSPEQRGRFERAGVLKNMSEGAVSVDLQELRDLCGEFAASLQSCKRRLIDGSSPERPRQ